MDVCYLVLWVAKKPKKSKQQSYWRLLCGEVGQQAMTFDSLVVYCCVKTISWFLTSFNGGMHFIFHIPQTDQLQSDGPSMVFSSYGITEGKLNNCYL